MSHPKRRSFRAPATLAVAGLAAALLVPFGVLTATPAAAAVGECPPGYLPGPGNQGGDRPSWTDDNVAVFAGGDFVADGGAAESEGLLVVMGDATFDKSGVFNVGWVGVGSQVAPTPGSVMLAVGGGLSLGPATTLDVGSGARDTSGVLLGGGVQVGGAATPAYPSPQYELNNGSIETGMGAAAVSEWSTFSTDIGASSASWVAMADTNPVDIAGLQATFTGDGTTAVQVFTITAAQLNGITEVYFENIADDAPVIINVVGSAPITFSPNYFANDGVQADVMTSPLFGMVAQRTMWNFADTTSVTFGGGSQFLGSVLAPNADFDITASMNGRVYAGGDIHMHGAGNELHNYPWIGDTEYGCIAGGQPDEPGDARLTKVLATTGVAAPDRWFFGWLECVGGDLGDSTFYREGMIQAGATLTGRDLPVGAQCTLHEDPYRPIEGQTDLPPGFLWAAPVWAVNGQPVEVPTFTVPGPGDPDVEVSVTNALLGQFSVHKVVTGPEGGYIGDRAFDIFYDCSADAYDDDGVPLGSGTDSGMLSVEAGQTQASAWFPVGTTCAISEQTPITEPGDFSPTGEFHWEAPVITPASLTIGAGNASPVAVTVTNTYAAGEPTTGSFTIDKVVQNPDELTFTDAFSGDWSCTAGESTQTGTWTVSSTGNPVIVSDIPVGAECTVTENTPAAVTGGAWDAPVITPATFTVSAQAAVAVTVTNTLRAVTAPETPSEGSGLPVTGGTIPVWAIAVGGVLLVAGAAVVIIALVRRRRS